MKPAIFLAAVCLLSAVKLDGYPIEPRPLRKLIIESKYIVIGFVMEVKEVEEKGGNGKRSWDDTYSVATIRIDNVLQGTLTEKTIEIRFHPTMICPSPDRYFPNTDVILFLDRNENGNFYVPALDYGAKTLLPEGIEIYKTRIKEMQDILAMQDKETEFMEIVSWLVKCAEHPVTRWEGTFELSPESDFMSYYAREERQPFNLMLNRADKDRLRLALLNQSRIEYSDLGLVDLVYMGTKDEVYDLLLRTLKSAEGDEVWYASELMERLTYANPGHELKQIIEQYRKEHYDPGKRRSRDKVLIKKFIAMIE